MIFFRHSILLLGFTYIWFICQPAVACDQPNNTLGNLLDEVKGLALFNLEKVPMTEKALELLDRLDHTDYARALDFISQYLKIRHEVTLTPETLMKKKQDFLRFWAKNQAHGTLYFRDLDYIDLTHYFHYQSIFDAFDRLQAAYKEAEEAAKRLVDH